MNRQQKDAYATYRWWSNIMSIAALMAVLTIIGLGWAWLLNGSWVEGLAFGFFLTGVITTAAINNEAFMTRWETQTKDAFEAQEMTSKPPGKGSGIDPMMSMWGGEPIQESALECGQPSYRYQDWFMSPLWAAIEIH